MPYYRAKSSLDAPSELPSPNAYPKRASKSRVFGVLAVLALLAISGYHVQPDWSALLQSQRLMRPYHHPASAAAMCPQVGALAPAKNAEVYETMGALIDGDAFKETAIANLAGAVQVPTESFDKMDDVGVDPRWEVFGKFHDYLEKTFLRVHEELDIIKVNTYGLVFIWQGTASPEQMKPLLLMGHQDTVPVEPTTVEQWAHPPFSGHFDGTRIWGRGSSDDKSGVIGILTTIETLLSQGFKPTRTVFLSFGFDEEASQTQGAQKLAQYLLATYGEDYFSMIIDEGGGYSEQFGQIFAVPAIAEKGYLDVRVEIRTPGGHSSIPPPHTSIGMLSALLVKYEANPTAPRLVRGSPVHGMVQCLAAHAPHIPKKLRRAIRKSATCDKALKAAGDELFKNNMFRSVAGTTQAVDIVSGGVKSNALPEQAFAVVNHRIATHSSIDEVQAHDTALLAELAGAFNLSYTAFGSKVSTELRDAPSWGTLELSDAWGTALAPAPVTPTDGAAYKLLSGTIKAAYGAHRGLGADAEDAVAIAPGIMTGNTDTRYYWKLSQNIFRYNHHRQETGGLGGVHTVNESVVVDSFLEMIRFFTTLILNADEAEL